MRSRADEVILNATAWVRKRLMRTHVPRSRKSKHQPNQQKMKIPQGKWVGTSGLVGEESWSGSGWGGVR